MGDGAIPGWARLLVTAPGLAFTLGLLNGEDGMVVEPLCPACSRRMFAFLPEEDLPVGCDHCGALWPAGYSEAISFGEGRALSQAAAVRATETWIVLAGADPLRAVVYGSELLALLEATVWPLTLTDP